MSSNHFAVLDLGIAGRVDSYLDDGNPQAQAVTYQNVAGRDCLVKFEDSFSRKVKKELDPSNSAPSSWQRLPSEEQFDESMISFIEKMGSFEDYDFVFYVRNPGPLVLNQLTTTFEDEAVVTAGGVFIAVRSLDTSLDKCARFLEEASKQYGKRDQFATPEDLLLGNARKGIVAPSTDISLLYSTLNGIISENYSLSERFKKLQLDVTHQPSGMKEMGYSIGAGLVSEWVGAGMGAVVGTYLLPGVGTQWGALAGKALAGGLVTYFSQEKFEGRDTFEEKNWSYILAPAVADLLIPGVGGGLVRGGLKMGSRLAANRKWVATIGNGVVWLLETGVQAKTLGFVNIKKLAGGTVKAAANLYVTKKSQEAMGVTFGEQEWDEISFLPWDDRAFSNLGYYDIALAGFSVGATLITEGHSFNVPRSGVRIPFTERTAFRNWWGRLPRMEHLSNRVGEMGEEISDLSRLADRTSRQTRRMTSLSKAQQLKARRLEESFEKELGGIDKELKEFVVEVDTIHRNPEKLGHIIGEGEGRIARKWREMRGRTVPKNETSESITKINKKVEKGKALQSELKAMADRLPDGSPQKQAVMTRLDAIEAQTVTLERSMALYLPVTNPTILKARSLAITARLHTLGGQAIPHEIETQLREVQTQLRRISHHDGSDEAVARSVDELIGSLTSSVS